jgi:hypothetical protein
MQQGFVAADLFLRYVGRIQRLALCFWADGKERLTLVVERCGNRSEKEVEQPGEVLTLAVLHHPASLLRFGVHLTYIHVMEDLARFQELAHPPPLTFAQAAQVWREPYRCCLVEYFSRPFRGPGYGCE